MPRFLVRLPNGTVPQPSMYATAAECCDVGQELSTPNGRRWRVVAIEHAQSLGRRAGSYAGVLTVEPLEEARHA